MGQSNAVGTAVEFGRVELKANAAVYREHKRLIDAASRYDSVDDAVAGLKVAWETLEAQIEKGASFTPPVEDGFGSDNAAVIAESLLGRRQTVGAVRKSFATLGK